ncbi:hypothetical protein POX_b02203 [Penicillium oxalicum]|uniref:hypothetical protein n=1 Tax=Penicillium oxalicum TaxID=69781 RepID=UPI0020B6E5B4|nr:hypothetical protein POX_b02203 [Penicillium oxalicum]KAI2792166.1 hypothetical protein POX_b02203 [Penicillium oxalicum]
MWRSKLPFRLHAKWAIVGGVVMVILQILYFLHRNHALPGQAASFHRQEIVYKLSTLTDAYTSTARNASVGLVLASIHTDDLTWLLDYCSESDSIPFVFSTEQPPRQNLLEPATWRGREAAAYLSYIVRFYDRLPAYSIFVHAFAEQWHNDLFGPNTINTLRNIRFQAVDAHGYVNLRCQHNPGCPMAVNPNSPSASDLQNNDIRAKFAQAYQQLFAVNADQVPDTIGNVCCGQFAVSRDRIRARPKEDYERILEWMATTELTDNFGVGWVMEKVWHIVFGMEPV